MLLVAQLPKEVLSHQLSNGLMLLVLGMGVVFFFLAILVVVTKIMSGTVRTIESRKPVAAPASPAPPAAYAPDSEAEIAAAIVAAVAGSGK